MLLHPTSSLNSQQQLQELLSSRGKGRFRPLGFHPLALEMWREKGSGIGWWVWVRGARVSVGQIGNLTGMGH